MSKKRLGRGLDALLSGDVSASASPPPGGPSNLGEIAVTDVVRGRYQPRREFNEAALNELAASIRAQGLMQPVVVRPRAQGGYELVAGERRWRAAKIAGLERIPASIREVTDEQASAMALIENIQREDLNPLEEAEALDRLKNEFELTQQQVADAVGKSRVAVTNLLRLLALAHPVQEMLLAGEIEMGHARALLSLELIDQERLARVVASKGLSVRATEAMVRSRQQPARAAGTGEGKDADTRRLERDLTDRLGAPVAIAHDGKGKGKVTISYGSLDQLDGVLRHLT